jgi:tripartite-type tricarboxylate transporter receptor subunit TctC
MKNELDAMTGGHDSPVTSSADPLSRRAVLLGLAFAPLSGAFAQSAAPKWVPDRPLRLIVPFPPGGATDLVGRLLSEKLKARLGQAVVIDNRGGANGIVAARLAVGAAPDGYTLFLGAIGTQAINPYIYPKMAVDPDKFVPIAAVNTVPTAFAIPKEGRARSLDEVIKLGSTGQGNYGHWAVASVPHIAGEMLKQHARIPKLQGIQYQGAAQCLQALIAGQIDIANLPLSLAKAQSERLTIVGLASSSRFPSAPEIPTMAELGYPVDVEAWYGVFAPPGTPKHIVDSLTSDINATMADPDMRKRMLDASLKPQSFPTAEAYQAWLHGERKRWSTVLHAMGIQPES